ncbi:MAG: hypothetical protein QME66_04350 [Candidatus Eisenbacteria bacterium]|nr:hypothetical protein [Candidatus Eisenbacteria bacterium]
MALTDQYAKEVARGATSQSFEDWSKAHTQNVRQSIQSLLGREARGGEAEALAAGEGDVGRIRERLVDPLGFQSREQATQQEAFARRQTQEREALQGRQRAEEEGLFREFERLSGAQEKLPTAMQRLRGEQRIPQLEEQLNIFKGESRSIKNLLDRLDEDVTTRTQGTLTNEAQRRRQIAAEEEPLQKTLGRLGMAAEPILEAISKGESNVVQQLQLLTAEQQRELQPVLLRIDRMSDRFSREMTGFTQDKQTQLTLLLDKMQSDRQLSQLEWQQANQLAAAEREFAQQKQLLEQQFAHQEKQALLGYEKIDLGNRVAITDKQGNILRYEPKGKVPGSGSGTGGTALDSVLNKLLGKDGGREEPGLPVVGGEALPSGFGSVSNLQGIPLGQRSMFQTLQSSTDTIQGAGTPAQGAQLQVAGSRPASTQAKGRQEIMRNAFAGFLPSSQGGSLLDSATRILGIVR